MFGEIIAIKLKKKNIYNTFDGHISICSNECTSGNLFNHYETFYTSKMYIHSRSYKRKKIKKCLK